MVRYLGPRALIEDTSIRSRRSLLVDMEAGYKLTPRTLLVLDVVNLFDSRDSDIDYCYPSRLPGKSADGVHDIHLSTAASHRSNQPPFFGFSDPSAICES